VKLDASVDISSKNVTLENVSMTHPVHLGYVPGLRNPPDVRITSTSDLDGTFDGL
jgi:hypothetical protein